MRSVGLGGTGLAAGRVLERIGGPSPDAFVLARCMRLRLHPRARRGPATMRGRDVFFDGRASLPRQHRELAQCCARVALRRQGLPCTPSAVRRCARMLTGAKSA